MEKDRHFTAVVIGDNPSEIIKKYDKKIKVEPYTAFKLSEAKKYRKQYIDSLKKMIDNVGELPTLSRFALEVELGRVTDLTDVDYYLELTQDYVLDSETGDVILDTNPDGKYDWCRPGKDLCMPMKDYEGNEIFSGRKKDIDWSKIHLYNKRTYETVWELCVEGKEPNGDVERTLFENMKNRKEYFNFFKTKENYVISNTAFWGYAYVDKNGWIELEDNIPQIEWTNNFYDRFIVPLPEDTMITLYECYRI